MDLDAWREYLASWPDREAQRLRDAAKREDDLFRYTRWSALAAVAALVVSVVALLVALGQT